jgi:hypothetical protein
LVTYILVGLRMEYDPPVMFPTTRSEPTTLDDLYGHLLSHELLLEHHHSLVDLSVSTNVAQCQPKSGRGQFARGSSVRFSNHGQGRGRRKGGPSHFSSSVAPVSQDNHSIQSATNHEADQTE